MLMADEESKDSGWNWIVGYLAAGPVSFIMLIVAIWLVSKLI